MNCKFKKGQYAFQHKMYNEYYKLKNLRIVLITDIDITDIFFYDSNIKKIKFNIIEDMNEYFTPIDNDKMNKLINLLYL